MSTTDELARLFGMHGKVAVVTGAASGIGKCVATLFVAAGARVIVADSNISEAERVAASLGAQASAVAFDLADDDSITALFRTTVQQCQTVDILINNAGIYPKYAFDALTEPDWQQMQRVNVWGCFVAMRAAANVMRAGKRGGRIINISSIGGIRTAVNNQIAYNASKAALDSMTQSAAMDLAPDNILVNSILPGAVRPLDPKPKSVSTAHAPPTGPLMQPGRILLGRAAAPDEIAAPVLMLASAAGAYITGQTLIIDGGFAIS